MNLAGFIARNALRNKRRAALSILSVAVSLFLFVVLLVVLRELTQPPDDRNMWLHQKYLDEALGNWGKVGMWWVRAESAEVAPRVIETINRTFANTANEVRAETERAFQMSFVSMWGNIRILITSICSVVVFTLLLVSI